MADEQRRHPRPGTARNRTPLEQMQVGRRPPNPIVVLFTGAMWVAVGVIMFLGLHAGWRWAAGIVSVGVGALFLRGGAIALIRQNRDR